MKTVLLTGAAGFTGQHLNRLLTASGYKVIPADFDVTKIEQIEDCFRNQKFNFIIHLAAISFVGHGDPMGFYDVNVMGTENLLKVIKIQSYLPEKVIISSSANIYGNPKGDEALNEKVCPAPVNHYACSKLAMEHIVRNDFDALPIIITRPFNYTGEGQADCFVIPKLVKSFIQNRPQIELGNIDVLRDFLDVEQVAQAYLGLLESEYFSITVNICSGETQSLREFIDQLSEIFSYRPELKVNPQFVRKHEIEVLKGNPALLTEITGYKLRFDMNSTLRKMIAAHSGL